MTRRKKKIQFTPNFRIYVDNRRLMISESPCINVILHFTTEIERILFAIRPPHKLYRLKRNWNRPPIYIASIRLRRSFHRNIDLIGSTIMSVTRIYIYIYDYSKPNIVALIRGLTKIIDLTTKYVVYTSYG